MSGANWRGKVSLDTGRLLASEDALHSLYFIWRRENVEQVMGTPAAARSGAVVGRMGSNGFNGRHAIDTARTLKEMDMMNQYQMRYARLEREQLEKLTTLEAKLGSWVVALEPEVKLAELSEAELAELQKAEQELDVILLAYKPVSEGRGRPRRRRAPITG
jgi:hypothetical protein